MQARARENGKQVLSAACWATAAGGLAVALAWIGLQEYGWNDYEKEARGAVQALVHGHLSSFFALSPSYGGSLLARSPFALLTSLLGGDALAVYRSLAVPCLLGAIALGLWLVRSMGEDGQSFFSRALVLVLCCANPLTLLALEIGHPDELLGGVLCVAAVLLASRDRWALAGLALGVAIANKPWALVAVGPVLIALPAHRGRCLLVAGAACCGLLGPFLLFATSSFVHASQAAATTTGSTFQPWQLWWFLGHVAPAGAEVQRTVAGPDRVPPAWIETISHPLIVLLSVPLTLLAWRRLRRRPTLPSDAMLLLALLLLARCALDPWDNVYYPLPFVLALLAWQTLRGKPPLLAVATTVAVLLNHGWMGSFATPDAEALVFAAWSVPLAVFLAVALLTGRGRAVQRDSEAAETAASPAAVQQLKVSRPLSAPSTAS